MTNCPCASDQAYSGELLSELLIMFLLFIVPPFCTDKSWNYEEYCINWYNTEVLIALNVLIVYNTISIMLMYWYNTFNMFSLVSPEKRRPRRCNPVENSTYGDCSQPVKLCGQHDFADTDLLEILYFFLEQE